MFSFSLKSFLRTKKPLFFIAALMLCFSVFSCSDSDSEDKTTTTTNKKLTGQSLVPDDVLKVEEEDNSVWQGTSNDEIDYEAPESGVTIKRLQLITAGPGADCSSQMTVSWHSPVPVNYIEYTTSDDTAFANAGKIWLKAELSKATKFTGNDATVNDGNYPSSIVEYGWGYVSSENKFVLDGTKFYVCKASLKDLKANTNYIYRVGTNGTSPLTSETYSFKTSGKNGGQFSFFWASDLHTPSTSASCINRISELINFANKNLKKKSLPELDYVLFTGDLVGAGASYDHWLCWDKIPELKNYMWATCVGNHDYYFDESYRNSYQKARVSPRWQFECTAFPATNTYEKSGETVTLSPSNYWYLYNRVLFIGVDSIENESCDPEYTSDLSSQKAWFKAVVKENKGKYDWIVAFQHYAYLDNNEDKYGHYKDWRSVYESCGVDFALASDSHEYSRTYEIKKNKKIAEDENGVVYVTSPMTEGNELSSITDKLYGKGSGRCEYYAGGVTGGCYFVVNSNSMTLYTIGQDGIICDQKTVGRKTR